VSIIEKAAGRIGQQRGADSAGQTAAAAPAAAAAVAAPVVAAPVVANAHDVAAVLAPVAKPAPAFAAPPAAAAAPGTPSDAGPETVLRSNTRRVELDLVRMQEIGLVTAPSGRTRLLEDFRVIKRPLLQRAFGERKPGENPNNLIMITSSLPGEGKTFTALNLAMSIAMELDHTVLLVDADVARPSVMKTLGIPEHRGLMDLLVDDKLDMADVMLRTNVDTLALLPAGTRTARATELLASSTMSMLVTEIANRYPDRIVIFDSPPLLLTSEARVLAEHMGQIVVVVEAQTTTQHAVRESLSQLEGCPNVNLIYNKARDFPGIEETYDYSYG
jgi:protein-tyrosine kinase